MKKLLSVCTILSLISCTTLSLAEGHHQTQSAFKVSKIQSGFHFLQGKGGNILLSEGEDGLLIVDSDYADLSRPLEKVLSGFERELKYVLNTHWHGDHTQGNLQLGHHASIVAHENVFKRLNSRQEVKLFNMVSEPYPAHALPDITYENVMRLRFNDETIRVIHLSNGHTDGDSVVFFENANIVHMGDHFFNGFFPFVDVGSNGSVRGVARNVDKVLAIIDETTVVVPGHGPISNKQELRAFRDMLNGTADEIEAMRAQKLDLEAIQEKGLSEQWDSWGGGFLNEATWIKIVFDSLEKNS